MLTIGVALKKEKTLLWLAVLLYIYGLLTGPYSATPFDITLSVDIGRGLLFSPVFVIAGSVLARYPYTLRNSLRTGLLITGAGLALQLSEAFLLWYQLDRPLSYNNFLIGTIPFGLGVAILALSLPNLGSNMGIAVLGRYTLGVYCVHVAVINSPFTWSMAPYFPSVSWQVLKPLVVYVVSLVAVLLMTKSSLLRKVVVKTPTLLARNNALS